MISKLIKIIAFTLVMAAVTGCATTKYEEPTILDLYGSYDAGEYVNNYYGFKFSLPETYVIQGDEMKEYFKEVGAKLLNGNDAENTNLDELRDEQLYNILIASKHEIGAPVDENIMIQVIAENLEYQPGVENGADYLWHVQNQLESSDMTVINQSEFGTEIVNGIEFTTYSYGLDLQSVVVSQKWFTKKVGDHIFCIALSNITDEGFKELEEILYTIELLQNSRMK
ncbi:MAG: hypothetical protein OCD02_16905 [Spirochaetaceae bacterium]